MELFSKEAVEAVESLSNELRTVKTRISQVGLLKFVLFREIVYGVQGNFKCYILLWHHAAAS